MLGGFRLVLAALVVFHHIIDRAPQVTMAGPIAVFGFYCLSGYLMTRVVNTTYADGLTGFGRYLANRALRIYPPYFAVMALTIATIVLVPAAGTRFWPGLFAPDNLARSLAIVGLTPATPTFIFPAWSLGVELLHYVAIGALLGRSRPATLLWFLAGIEIAAVALMRGIPFEWLYYNPIGSTVAFAGGAMIWHFRDALPRSHAGAGASAVVALALLSVTMSPEIGTAGGIYVGLALSAICVILLRDLPELPFGRRCGDLAYPVFLLHMPVDKVVRGLLGADGRETLLVTLPLTLALSWLLMSAIETPIARWRDRLRRSATTAATPASSHAAMRSDRRSAQ